MLTPLGAPGAAAAAGVSANHNPGGVLLVAHSGASAARAAASSSSSSMLPTTMAAAPRSLATRSRHAPMAVPRPALSLLAARRRRGALAASTRASGHSAVPPAQGLFDPSMDRDSCGVGFVAELSRKPARSVVTDALKMLERMTHRGACGCESNTGEFFFVFARGGGVGGAARGGGDCFLLGGLSFAGAGLGLRERRATPPRPC